MTARTVTTQAELDAALADHAELHEVDLHGRSLAVEAAS